MRERALQVRGDSHTSVTASITRVVSMVIISRISMRSAPSVNPEGNLARGGVGGWTYQKEDRPVLFRASL